MRMRTILLSCLLAVIVCLTGCSECEHQWMEASCEKAKTCSRCGMVEGYFLGHEWREATCVKAKVCAVCGKIGGSPLGHSWKEATCTEVRTCTVCNATEGEPLGHQMAPANYQEASQCAKCGYEKGKPLAATYEGYPIETIDVQLGVAYDYVAACYIEGYTTVGKLTWDNYRVFASDDSHEAVEGYQWHSVTVSIVFSDRAAQRYGFIVQSALDDYFWVASQEGNGYTDSFTVNFYGQLYDQCLMDNGYGVVSDWVDGACTYTAEFAWRVPVGYDGHLILFYNAAMNLDDMLKNGDDTLLAFRFTE